MLLKDNYESKKINLILNIHSNLPVYAYLNMVNSTFRNILSNGIKFTPQGGVIEIHF